MTWEVTENDKKSHEREATVKKRIVAFLKVVRPNGFFFKIPAGPLSLMGVSDIIGCYSGRFYAFEIKSSTGRPTKRQKFFLKCIRRAGGVAAVVRSVADVKEILNEIRR